ncbi:leucine-rich repeat-containing protein 61-like [Babylonia areolata]|uniref:leucine-rich repeat-containing protein 61-like n=1 Tax=Babylonia areolata TaxID=304850 RepID=UPI003FD51524
MTASDGRITKTMLKLATGEFELESIHTVVLKKSDITDLGCLGECLSLERLDLSYNDITKLHKLAGLSTLQCLNLSANRISALDGLQPLENLRSLNIAGNLIGSVDSLRCLCGLENLRELRLMDEGRELSNPACMLPSYASDVINMLPSLQVLDGQRVRGKGSEVFYICQDMDKKLKSWKDTEISVPLVDMKRQPSELWRLPDRSAATHNKAEEQLKDLLISCHHLSIRAGERLEELQRSKNPTDTDVPPVASETAAEAS